MTQEQAVARISEFIRSAPVLSEIPSSSPTSDMRVRHGGYDIRSTERDPNVTFPIERLREALAEGRVGGLADIFYSFPGATAQGRLRTVVPEWVERLHNQEIDLMLLVPI